MKPQLYLALGAPFLFYNLDVIIKQALFSFLWLRPQRAKHRGIKSLMKAAHKTKISEKASESAGGVKCIMGAETRANIFI